MYAELNLVEKILIIAVTSSTETFQGWFCLLKKVNSPSNKAGFCFKQFGLPSDTYNTKQRELH